MRVSTIALAALCAITSKTSLAQSSSSKYVYKPDGLIFNGKFLPGPNQWEGQCNDGSQEQTPVAIEVSDWPARSDITIGEYAFNPGTCGYDDLKYGVEDNGVKITFDATKCTPPSVTLPNDPNLLTVGLGLNPEVALGEEVFGLEAGKTYEAAQFHIHSSSEHTIDGQTFEAEMHIVHLQSGLTGIDFIDEMDLGSQLGLGAGLDGSRGASVVGFMIQSSGSTPNSMFENLLKGWEAVGCGITSANVDGNIVSTGEFNPYEFLDSESCIMNYDGGLTTPTCDEIVEWNLATTPITISHQQMRRLLALINDCPESVSFADSTSRPIQPLNGRTINQICPADRRNLRH